MNATRKVPHSYEFGVKWIALNDDPLVMDIEEVSGFISTCLLADLFGRDQKEVAEDVVRYREEHP